MPLGARSYRKRKRPYYAPKRRTRPRTTTLRRRTPRYRVPRAKFTGMGRKIVAKLRYVDFISINAPAAGVAAHVFRANGLYDPDVTGTGHQPIGFDEFMARYNHYCVLGAKIKVQYMPSSAANVIPGVLGCLLTDTGGRVAGATSISHLLEHPGRGAVANTGVLLPKDLNARVTKTYSAKKFFGKPVWIDDRHLGNSTNNPSEDAFFEVYIATVNGNDPGAVDLLVQIDFIAMFTEPKPLPQS